METLKTLTLEVADKIAYGVINAAKRNNFAPVTVNILNQNGEVVIQKRMDGCPPKGIPEFSLAKAKTAFLIKMSSRDFRDRFSSNNDPKMFCAMTSCVEITGG